MPTHCRFLCLVLSSVFCGCSPQTSHSEPPRVQTPLDVSEIDHIGFAVTDLDASRAFFVEVLGFRESGFDPDYPASFLSNDRAFVTLWRVEDPPNAVAFNRRQNVGLHHLALSVRSFDVLDALHHEIASFPGARIEFSPELAYGGPARHMMVRDPSGLRIELVHRPDSK
ncbi:MAG: VOC family protein [Myxococcales bacterium FL481]|nr:MAG: VOC family protein [Myxococcales bacterium FL481]